MGHVDRVEGAEDIVEERVNAKLKALGAEGSTALVAATKEESVFLSKEEAVRREGKRK